MTQCFQVRFHPCDLSGHTFTFLDKFNRFILAREDKNKKGETVQEHFHIYIETTDGEKTVRDSIKAGLRIPPSGRGKNNKYYSLIADWKDPGYICKWNEVVKSKGYTEREIMDYVISGKNKYLKLMGSGNEVEKVTTPVVRKTRINDNKEIQSQLYCWVDEYFKENNVMPDKTKLVHRAMAITRQFKGINIFQIRDFCHTVIFDYGEYIRSKNAGLDQMEQYMSPIFDQNVLIRKISELL